MAAKTTDIRFSSLAREVKGSEILKIGADIRTLLSEGKRICNLTIGDFHPDQFRPPSFLLEEIGKALAKGESNYPPSEGMLVLRKAIRGFYEKYLGLDYPVESVLVHSGARPGIYGAYRTLVDPGDTVVYPVPSWNNNYYCQLVGAIDKPIPCRAENSFLPTGRELRDAIRGARLLVLNSPANPTGTAFAENALEEICDCVLEENKRRGETERPLFLVYDQVYWMLTFGGVRHFNPVGLRPELREYTLLVDGISKGFASTGLRVGWTVGPADIVRRSGTVLMHVGSWAPRPEQVATALLLEHHDVIDQYVGLAREGVRKRLDLLYDGLVQLEREGFPVTAIEPMGAMFLSAKFDLQGKRKASGEIIQTHEDIRTYLLFEALMAFVPFHAFGAVDENNWVRLSVGAVSADEIREMFPRLKKALAGLK